MGEGLGRRAPKVFIADEWKEPLVHSGKPVDPAWMEWAERETVRMLRARLEQDRDSDRPEPPAPQAQSPAQEAAQDPIRLVHEIDLDDSGEPQPDTRVATRADGLVIRIHRANV